MKSIPITVTDFPDSLAQSGSSAEPDTRALSNLRTRSRFRQPLTIALGLLFALSSSSASLATRHIEARPARSKAELEAQRLLREAEKHAFFFDHTRAIALCNQALAKDPQFYAGYLERARCYSATGKHKEALADYAMALKSTDWGLKEDILRDRASFLYSLKRYKEAKDDIDTIEKKDRALTDGLYVHRAMCSLALHQPEAAVKDISAAIKMKGPQIKLLSLRAEAYGAARQYKEAAADYTAVIEREKRDGGLMGVSPDLFKDRANMYEAMGKMNMADQDRKLAREVVGFERGRSKP